MNRVESHLANLPSSSHFLKLLLDPAQTCAELLILVNVAHILSLALGRPDLAPELTLLVFVFLQCVSNELLEVQHTLLVSGVQRTKNITALRDE